MTLVYPPGDFGAFLTAILETWIHRTPEWAVVPASGDWFGPEGPRRTVLADPASADRVWTGVRSLAGPEAAQALSEAFRHTDPGKEPLLAGYIRLCVRHGRKTLDRLVDPEIRETLRRARAVRSEAHRCLGLVRFQSLAGGGWYGRFEPDHDVAGLLVDGFRPRFGNRDWMLHDVGRRTAWVSLDGTGAWVGNLPARAVVPQGFPGETEVQDLWRRYFQTAAIPGKDNPGLQKSRMPEKTWKYLVEDPAYPGPPAQ